MHGLITDGQAKRLARQFGLTVLHTTGAIRPVGDKKFVRQTVRPDGFKDPQGYEADRRALLDYIEQVGSRPSVHEWNLLREDTTVVPWCYPR